MPHAEIDKIKEPVISIYINRNGIDWDNEMVSIVFFFALNQDICQSIDQVYNFFNELIQNKQQMRALLSAENFLSVIDTLKKGR